MKNFVKSIPTVEKKIINLAASSATNTKQESKENDKEYPPVRETKIINANKAHATSAPSQATKKVELKPTSKSSNKSPKPKDYGEWNK